MAKKAQKNTSKSVYQNAAALFNERTIVVSE